MANASMTPRQKQVYDRLKRGETPPQIAKALKMTTNGVYQHRRRLEERGLLDPSARPTAPNGSSNGRRKSASGGGKAVVPPNGLIAETARTLDSEINKIEGAIGDNLNQRRDAEAEMAAIEERLGGLNAEDEDLTKTESALKEARSKVVV